MYFGVESGSPDIIKRLKKGITKEQVEEAFEVAKRYEIKTQAFFLLGIPGETIESMKETIDFSIRLDPDNAQFAGVIPHPGTALYDQCKRKGYLKASKWEDFAASNLLIETKDFTVKDVEAMRQYAYRKFYFRTDFILKTVTRMTSLREIKRIWRGFKSILNRVIFYEPKRLDAMRGENQSQNNIDSFHLFKSSHRFEPLYRRT